MKDFTKVYALVALFDAAMYLQRLDGNLDDNDLDACKLIGLKYDEITEEIQKI